ncbi:MAG TPA: phospholipid carrier-dependent glycosyltransferase, partial [Burkholderiales bacterium]|nr:phospholipid carrier-dependent glycosyltransferase [Burkholderiales bacterium]
TWWWLYAAAALSLYTTLGLPYIGEEAVYTITSLEMRLNHDFFVTTLYGNSYGRPPLLNWLIIPLAEMLGWDRMLLASRIVTATATVATGLTLAWLTLNLTRNRALAAFAAVVFLSGDVLFYRGWLAYADSLLTLGVFGAIACLWVAVLRKQGSLLWLAVLLVTAGFLAKVQTAYLFYGVAFVVLAAGRDARRFLLGVHSIAAHAAAVAGLLAWNAYFTHGTQSASTVVDILLKIKSVDLGEYLHQLWSFPPETLVRLAPASLIAAYFAWSTRNNAKPVRVEGFPWRTLLAMLLLNYLPYWLGPKTHIRYIMPLYPLAALALAVAIWNFGERPRIIAARWFLGAVVLRYAVGLWIFPWYQEHYRGDYAGTAAQIAATTRAHPLYATDVSATGLSVTAHLDTLRYPAPYVHWPPAQWSNGFVLSYAPNPELGQVAATYPLGGNMLYLLCRGSACADASPATRQ